MQRRWWQRDEKELIVKSGHNIILLGICRSYICKMNHPTLLNSLMCNVSLRSGKNLPICKIGSATKNVPLKSLFETYQYLHRPFHYQIFIINAPISIILITSKQPTNQLLAEKATRWCRFPKMRRPDRTVLSCLNGTLHGTWNQKLTNLKQETNARLLYEFPS